MQRFSLSRIIDIIMGPHVAGSIWRHIYFFTAGRALGSLHRSSYISPLCRIGRRRELKISAHTRIAAYTNLAGQIDIGQSVEINPFVSIYGKVSIGDDVLIAPAVTIVGGNHKFSDLTRKIRDQGNSEKGIVIGSNVWIGANCVILDGCIIGSGSVIGAGTVLRGTVPPNSVVRRGDQINAIESIRSSH